MVFTDEKSFVPAVVDDIKDIKDDELLKKTIKNWYEETRTQGMRLGAKMICAAGEDILKRHLTNKSKPSLRDYERATKDLIKLFSVPLKQSVTEQNNSGEGNGEENSI